MAKMDLKTAYNKIDNLCCLNSSTNSNFFDAYKETHDEDFCKDANEMIDALEVIREAVEFQDKLQTLITTPNKDSKKLKKVSECTVEELERYYSNKTGCTPDCIAIYWYDVRFIRLNEDRNKDKVEFYLMKSDEIGV